MPTENPYRLYSREQLEAEAARNQKIIVALFLFLGKAVTALTLPQRDIRVTESEIRKAWEDQKSPVRILSELMPNYMGSYATDPAAEYRPMNERVYKIHLQELNLMKVGFMHHGQKCPEYEASTRKPDSSEYEPKKGRVFDLE